MRRVLAFLLLMAVSGCASTGKSPLAIDRADEAMVGRYMGGGAHFGRNRRRCEGTWATDYAGLDAGGLIQLRWCMSDELYQGGIGSY